MEYRKRIADKLLKEQLDAMGAVLVEGPKACGKTTTAEQIAGSVLYMADPRTLQTNMQIAETDITMLLKGKTPRLIDEWQVVPQFWDAIRFTVDHRRDVGQFILTGSAVPVSSRNIVHSGTGRFGWVTMRPMSLWESGDSTGEVSLGSLFLPETQKVSGLSHMDLEHLAFLICRGGWPSSLLARTDNAALLQARNYYDAIVHADISRVDNVRRDSGRVMRLMRSYARHQGTPATISTLLKDMVTNDVPSLSDTTVAEYLSALRKIFVVEDMKAWNPNLRSKSAIRTADNRYFVDPSVAVAALELGTADLMNDLNTMGLLFETLCVRDLRVYADALHGTVYHYRDRNGLECDTVVHLRNGSYGLVEIKLGGERLIEEGAANLLKLEGLIDTTRMKAPAFKMVLVGIGSYAYRRADGVYVVPVSCLKE